MSTPPSPPGPPAARRWVADPLLLLGLTAAAGLAVVLSALGLGPALPAGTGWAVPALLGVTAAGIALSGST